MTLAPNVTDLDESNLPHYKPKQKHTITTEALVNNANNLSNNASSEDGLVHNEHQNIKDKEFNLINEKLKQLKLNNDMDKYNQLLELKKRLADDERSSHQQQNLRLPDTKSKIDLNELKGLLKMITNHLNEGEEKKVKGAGNQSHLDETSLFNGQRSTLSSLNDEFKKAITDLDQKLNDFENLVGKQKNFAKRSSSLAYNSSYTLSLIQIVSTMMDYVREATVELNYEKLKQTEASKQLEIHRKLIDGLTTEILTVKEQNENILNDHISQSARMEADLDQIKVDDFF
jgi:hypothetical protein